MGKVVLNVDPLWITLLGSTGGDLRDCLTGERPFEGGAEYPKSSRLNYLAQAALWIGAVHGRDTLVSRNHEILPVEPTVFRSVLDPTSANFVDAVSQQDYILTGTDTIDPGWTLYEWPDYSDGLYTWHKPLNLEVTQKSYAWSYSYAQDFILFDVEIQNTGDTAIENAYFGLCYAPHVLFSGTEWNYYGPDDLIGFVSEIPIPTACNVTDTINLMWGADNDGDPVNGQFIDYKVKVGDEYLKSVPDVAGMFFIDYPHWSDLGPVHTSYNWWAYDWVNYDQAFDFGPQRWSSFRDFRTGRYNGYPSGDPNRYHLMSNREIDWDPAFASTISCTDPYVNCPPQDWAANIADGFFFQQVQSIGPYTIPPRASIHLAYAFVAGEDFHTDPNNIVHLPTFPTLYYNKLDFSDLFKNAMWAKWIYDNPGYDTDGDGDSGKFDICVYDSIYSNGLWIPTSADTVYYAGDGIPDWRAAAPPPPPTVWITPIIGGFHVRFNGQRSETDVDVFSKLIDFEGYRVYLGRDERESSYNLVASYDKENYDKYIWDKNSEDDTWLCLSFPFTLDSLRCLYGYTPDPCDDSLFHPLNYTRADPYRMPGFSDSIFFFRIHDYNVSELGVSTPIRKTYPDQPDPSLLPEESLPSEYYTDDGYLKYYEYEFEITGLLPTVEYWLNVTAFDFGDPKSDMPPLESSITLAAQNGFPLTPSSADPNRRGKVYVYPNPYRGDADYRDLGYEGRTEEDRPDCRVRELNFGNLPPKCKIYIYSLDGDLIRELDHDYPPDDPHAAHDSWNLITRNTQMVVTGLYYWVVEAEDGSTQMGKFVVIF
ncbi:MAG: hypothetical protein AB1483_08020 [Candidatus Zixiibacteriota bacterium]